LLLVLPFTSRPLTESVSARTASLDFETASADRCCCCGGGDAGKYDSVKLREAWFHSSVFLACLKKEL
jgi:hypothetical protein